MQTTEMVAMLRNGGRWPGHCIDWLAPVAARLEALEAVAVAANDVAAADTHENAVDLVRALQRLAATGWQPGRGE